MARPRGRPGYDVDTLLPIAVDAFNQGGYDGTSMEDLSQKLGITKSAIYHHVASKEELLARALDVALDGLEAVVDETRAMDAPAITRLEYLVSGSIAVLVDKLRYVTLLLRVHGNTATERRALARRREFDRYVAELVKQAEADGDVRPDVDPGVTARLLFGMVNSLIEWYRPRRGMNADELAEAVAKIAFDGLRSPNGVNRQPDSGAGS